MTSDDGEGLVRRIGAPRVEPLAEGPAPDDRQLASILRTATTVPDHGGLRPWRFVVITGPGKARFADALEAGLREVRGPDQPGAAVAKMRAKAYAAPCTVALIASPDPGSNIPVWEQVASASCTGYAIVLAAVALGFGAVWKSAAVVDAMPVRALLRLAEDERLLGWVNIGPPGSYSRKAKGKEGPLDLGALVTVLADEDRPFGSAPPTG